MLYKLQQKTNNTEDKLLIQKTMESIAIDFLNQHEHTRFAGGVE